MKYDSAKHHRRSNRLKGYDYTQPGAYFATLCTQGRACLFGDVVGGEMRLNDVGPMVDQCWRAIPEHFPRTVLDAFAVMPNHIHGIICIVGARHAVPLPTTEQFGRPVATSVPTIIRSFKSAVTKRTNELDARRGAPIWQRNYYPNPDDLAAAERVTQASRLCSNRSTAGTAVTLSRTGSPQITEDRQDWGLLRTHHPRRRIPQPHPAIHPRQPRTVDVRPGKHNGDQP